MEQLTDEDEKAAPRHATFAIEANGPIQK